ncbi:MAG: single-stranded DNA-binding protein [Firmicutes bacterium]|nr:single-stranded DNA-binding protein [Bacillota bacterium]
MNNVQLIGRLTRDPELRYSTGANQTAICRFSLAINSGYGDNQRTDYPNIVVFGKQAENCDKYLAKGRQCAVVGRIQTGSYTNKNGDKVYTTEVIANNVEFLGGGQQSGGQNYGNQGYDNNSGFGGGQSFNDSPSDGGSDVGMPGGFSSLQDDDIPF